MTTDQRGRIHNARWTKTNGGIKLIPEEARSGEETCPVKSPI